jgi:uncharacterized glyoxalase superfamily protein PhnB
MTDKTPPPQMWPTLMARDGRVMVRFLVDAFGFEEIVVHGEGDRVDHAELAWPPGGSIMLGSARDSGTGERPQGSFGVYAVTDEPDALFERAIAAGAKVVRELSDTDYGSREFAVADPEGNQWSFGTYRGAPRG